jgi:bifunctional aspartokinase / homoserine dehydrogenase 1
VSESWQVYKFAGGPLGSPAGIGPAVDRVASALAEGGRLAVVVSPPSDDKAPGRAGAPGRGALEAARAFAEALRGRGIAARAVDPTEFLAADEGQSPASVGLGGTAGRRFAAVASSWGDDLPVVAGGIARGAEGRVAGLGRNGSDYTATLLAALLKAGSVTFWTEGLGVMTADPLIVPEALTVEHLSYGEALELAYFGTRMLHPRMIEPVLGPGIPLFFRSASDPGAAGTRIDPGGNPDPNRPTCVTSLENLSLLGMDYRRADIGRPIGGRIVSALAEAGLRVWLATESTLGHTFSALVPRADEARALGLIRSVLRDETGRGEIVVGEPLGPVTMVALVAEAMGRRPNVAGRFLGAIGRAGIGVRAVAQGLSQRSISCVVDAADTPAAVRAVHAAFNLSHAEISVMLLGKGLVGRSLLAQVASQGSSLRRNHDVQLRLVGIADSAGAILDPAGINPAGALERLRGARAAGAQRPVNSLMAELSRLPNPVVVDCTAADGMQDAYSAAFSAGINVVSANKKPLALTQASHDELKAAARRHYRAYRYETTVGAALPVIETLKDLVRTGDNVVRVEGAFSGTLGFLCERLAAGERLSSSVRRARELGYTEPNPRDDLSGLDVARKALILAREIGLRLDLRDVGLEPFVPAPYLRQDDPEAFLASLGELDQGMAARVADLRGRGCLLRYLARIEPGAAGPKVSVGPVEVDAAHPAASLRGAEAFVAFYTERYGDHPLIVRGAGAGGDVTAAGVLADILRLGHNIRGQA